MVYNRNCKGIWVKFAKKSLCRIASHTKTTSRPRSAATAVVAEEPEELNTETDQGNDQIDQIEVEFHCYVPPFPRGSFLCARQGTPGRFSACKAENHVEWA